MDLKFKYNFLKNYLDENQDITKDYWKKYLKSEIKPEIDEDIYSFHDLKDFEADKEKIWSGILSGLEHKRKNTHKKLLVWASSAAAILIVISSIWFLNNNVEEDFLHVNKTEFSPGETKAILILPDGEKINIIIPKNQKIIYQNEEYEITIDSTGLIKYSDSEIGDNKYNTIVVPRGGEFKVQLSDGTIVWLNSESTLTYPLVFAGNERNVELTGEAYFDVQPGKKPFRVSVLDMIVNVLGTKFNINAYQDNGFISTTLVSGVVEIQKKDRETLCILKPDQQADFKDGRIQVYSVNAKKTISWVDGRFYFDNMPLEEIMLQLVRWYDFNFEFKHEELKEYEFTGFFGRDFTAEEIFEIINKTTKVKFTRDHNNVIIEY